MKTSASLAVFAVLAINPFLLAGTRWAEVGEGRLEIKNAELQSGRPDLPSVAPLRHTAVAIQVRGFVAEVSVTQEFENALKCPIEAEYVFPLPQDAAVNATEMRIGERVIRGRVDRREAAAKAYETAKSEGKRASLLEQERPNIFTQSVANIGPGESIHVVIRYVETLPYSDGSYKIVFPMVVGPRYIPGVPVDEQPGQARPGHGREADTDQVPDASRITPPALSPGERCGFDIDVTVDIDAGVPIRGIRSPSHRVELQREGESRVTVRLTQDDRIPNKDFVVDLEVAGEQPEIGVLAHHDGKHGYFTLVLQPPKVPSAEQTRPREILCVLDCSGSMTGQPLELEKRAAERLLAGLAPTDRFNIFAFNMRALAFQNTPVPATLANVSAGIGFVRSLRAEGGTEMMTGVRAALADPAPEGYLRIVAFFTDGYIGNEESILREEGRLLGAARLFSFGVGSSVNRYLLDGMADVGRGTVEYVLLNDRPEEAVDRFVHRIAAPVLTDVSVSFAGLDVHDLMPSRVPDVFAGMPVYIYGRYEKGGEATIEVTGRVGVQPNAAKVPVVLPEPDGAHSPLPSVWARQRIKQLERDKFGGQATKSLEEKITQIALEYSLMSAYTSFVAVDETASAFAQGPPKLVPVAVPIPEGVRFEMTINEMANGQSRGSGCAGGGGYAGGGGSGRGIGGGPVGPLGVAGVAVLAVMEWRRRRRGAA